MKLKTNLIAKAISGRPTEGAPDSRRPTTTSLCREDLMSLAVDLTHPEMERRLRAQHVWEFLDESKSSFYARMKATEHSYDPLFPKPIPMSSTGKGAKRWKLGDVIAWLRICEAAANNS